MTRRVVVVGGGLAGLTAAYRLTTHQPDWHVELHEASDRVGGNIRTSEFAGQPIDEAADAFLLRHPWAVELCTELGLGPDLVNPSGLPAAIWASGELHDLPAPHSLGVPLDPGALAESALVGPDAVASLEADLAGEVPPVDPGDSVGRLLRSRLGDEITDRIVEPLLMAVYASPVDELSLNTVTPQFAAAANAPSFTRALSSSRPAANDDIGTPVFAGIRGGMQRLIDGLVARLDGRIRCCSAVSSVTPTEAGVDVTIADDVHRYDAAIIATPGHRTLELLDSPAAHAFATDPVSVAFITMALDRDTIGVPLDRSGFLVPADAGRHVTACSWTTTKWPHLDAEPFIVRAALGRADGQPMVTQSDDRLVELAQRDTTEMMRLTASPLATRVSRWPNSFPRYRPGHLHRLAEATELLAGGPIALAGASTMGVGIPTTIRSANEAALRIAELG